MPYVIIVYHIAGGVAMELKLAVGIAPPKLSPIGLEKLLAIKF